MIAIAIGAETVMAKLDENRARLAKLADPRTINLNDAEADRLVDLTVPVYYITGTIHSPETGAPTALMELAYRLVVDDSPYIKQIRSNVITMITPVIETDGRDRQVDIYKWHLANPGQSWPSLAYWGKYVSHDNNRDAMGATLALTRNVINFSAPTPWQAPLPTIHAPLSANFPLLYLPSALPAPRCRTPGLQYHHASATA